MVEPCYSWWSCWSKDWMHGWSFWGARMHFEVQFRLSHERPRRIIVQNKRAIKIAFQNSCFSFISESSQICSPFNLLLRRLYFEYWKPKKTSKPKRTRNSFWNYFVKRRLAKFTILSTEFLTIKFLSQMLSKSWLTVCSMEKLNKSPNLKQIFTKNWSNSWGTWRPIFKKWHH